MATFACFNTDSDNNDLPLAGNATLDVGPIYTGVSTRLAGSVFSDKAGTVTVYQSFEDPDLNHWDIVQYPVTNGTVTGGTPVTIDLAVLGPYVKVHYVNGAAAQGHLRIYIRCFGVERG